MRKMTDILTILFVKDYLLKLKDPIDISIACIKCRNYGHHVTECGKKEKAKKEKTKEKQDGVDIKPVTLATRLNDRSKNGKTKNKRNKRG